MELALQIITLLGSVAMLMYGMKVMSEGLQKMAGSKLSNVLGTMTTNRFMGVITGAGITAAVQSSTATTVMTVSFVSAGILSLSQAISVIGGNTESESSHFGHHGCEYRNHIHRMDYGAWRWFLRPTHIGLYGYCACRCTYIHEEECQHGRFPYRFIADAIGFDYAQD